MINSIDVGCRWTIDKHQINSTNAGCTEQLNITLETFQRCNRGVITKGSSTRCHKADPINVHNYSPTITTCLHRQMRSNSLCLSQRYPVCSWHTASSIPQKIHRSFHRDLHSPSWLQMEFASKFIIYLHIADVIDYFCAFYRLQCPIRV